MSAVGTRETESFRRTIQLFLVDGRPSGLRRATLHGWTGAVLVSGQATFAALTTREEVDRTGVYVLTGPDPEDGNRPRAYVGSGNSVAERIKQSAQERAFWETAVTVTTSDDDLSKGHAEYLEARIIELAAAAGRVTLDNGRHPPTARRRLPEADRANMEQFLVNLRVVLPVIGLDMLKPQPRAARETASPLEARTEGEARFEIRHRSGVKAQAVEEEGEFVVLEGSEALVDTGRVQQSYGPLKARLRADGVLVPHGADRLRFAKPYAFAGPSAASAVILDRNSNGRIEWRVRGSAQTYADWQQAVQGASEAAA
jgi:hypothetical protein